jgi:hypothetical protein
MERRLKWVQCLLVQIGGFGLEKDSEMKWDNHQQHFSLIFPGLKLESFQQCLGFLEVMVDCMEEEMEWVMVYEF